MATRRVLVHGFWMFVFMASSTALPDSQVDLLHMRDGSLPSSSLQLPTAAPNTYKVSPQCTAGINTLILGSSKTQDIVMGEYLRRFNI